MHEYSPYVPTYREPTTDLTISPPKSDTRRFAMKQVTYSYIRVEAGWSCGAGWYEYILVHTSTPLPPASCVMPCAARSASATGQHLADPGTVALALSGRPAGWHRLALGRPLSHRGLGLLAGQGHCPGASDTDTLTVTACDRGKTELCRKLASAAECRDGTCTSMYEYMCCDLPTGTRPVTMTGDQVTFGQVGSERSDFRHSSFQRPPGPLPFTGSHLVRP